MRRKWSNSLVLEILLQITLNRVQLNICWRVSNTGLQDKYLTLQIQNRITLKAVHCCSKCFSAASFAFSFTFADRDWSSKIAQKINKKKIFMIRTYCSPSNFKIQFENTCNFFDRQNLFIVSSFDVCFGDMWFFANSKYTSLFSQIYVEESIFCFRALPLLICAILSMFESKCSMTGSCFFSSKFQINQTCIRFSHTIEKYREKTVRI